MPVTDRSRRKSELWSREKRALSRAAVSPGGTNMPAAPSASTARYPTISEATTGMPAARASVSTIPKLSPPSEGAQSICAFRICSNFTSTGTRPSASTPSRQSPEPFRDRVKALRSSRLGPTRTSDASGILRRRSAKASSRMESPFRGSARPMKRMRPLVLSALLAVAYMSTSMPLGITRYSPGKCVITHSLAASETATLTAMLDMIRSASGLNR